MAIAEPVHAQLPVRETLPSSAEVRVQPRVLYLSHDGALEPLGQSQVVAYLRGLAERGAALTLLSFEKPEDLRDPARAEALRRVLGRAGIRWVPLRYHRAPALLGTAWDLLRGTVRAWRIIREERIGCVHARSDVAALIAWILKRALGVRFLFDMRGFWADERLEGGRGSAAVTYRLMKRLELRFLREADAVVTLTHEARRTVESWLNGRGAAVTVIPTCVDLERFTPAPGRPGPVQAPVFIYAGSIAPWCLPGELLRWIGQARRRWPAARLVLVTRQRAAALSVLRESGADPEAVDVVSAEPAEIPHWLTQADAGLAFYQPGFSRKGTCPTKLGEYLATGLPVVVNTGVGDVDEMIGGGRAGAVLPDFSEGAFAGAMDQLEQLWQDPGLRSRCRTLAEQICALELGVERYWTLYVRSAPPAAPSGRRGI